MELGIEGAIPRFSFLLSLFMKLGFRPSDGHVLDLGCNLGTLAIAISQFQPRSIAASYVGLDVDPEALSRAKTLVPGADFVRCDARKLPFASSTFNRAFAISILEHINPEELWTVLDELFSAMNHKGVLAVQIPNPYFPIELHSKIPLLFYLPYRVRRRIYREVHGHDMGFYKLSQKELIRTCSRVFRLGASCGYWYPPPLLRFPKTLHKAMSALGIFRLIPMGYVLTLESHKH